MRTGFHSPSRPEGGLSRWLRRSAALLALSLAPLSQAAEPMEVTIAYLGDPASTAYLGAEQGVREANVQGRFLGQNYVLALTAVEDFTTDETLEVDAIVADTDAGTLRMLAVAQPDIPIFNVSATDDSLRADCTPNLLHVIPSDRMRADAEAQWAEAEPDSPARARAWNPAFRKYAAGQLNQRYSSSTGQPMDDTAWAGWAAVKLYADSVARLKSTAPEAVLAHVKGEMQFDGQKGITMNFRETGQLRQILLLEADGKVVGEAPVRGVAKTTDLDSLGQVECSP